MKKPHPKGSAGQAELLRRQKVLAQFGEFVLDHDDIDEVLNEACRLIAVALGADLAKVIEIDRDKDEGFVRAGIGWKDGIVGTVRLDLDERSSEAYAIAIGEPVITDDISKEKRFHFPDFLKEHGVVALINVPIMLPGRVPYGILQVDTRETRDFDQEDIDYLKTYAMTLGPVIDRLNSLTALRDTDRQLRAAFEVVPVAMGIIGTDGRLRLSNPQIDRFMPTGIIPSREKDREKRWDAWDPKGDRVDPHDWPSARALRGKAVIPGMEMRYLQDDGAEVWTRVATAPITDNSGRITGAVVVIHDVTAFKNADTALRMSEQHQRLLLAELQHRVRNTLAVVRSIARRTAENSNSVDEMLGHFQGRLDAFSRVQAALTRNPDGLVSLTSLIDDELVAHALKDGGQVKVDGPELLLEPKTAERFSLAIHELATNAVKHGALANERGRIAISWAKERLNGSDGLVFHWRESCVEIPDVNRKRQGFGMELLGSSLPYDLDAETSIVLRPDGLQFELKMPIPKDAARPPDRP